jgi:hypothetical protein
MTMSFDAMYVCECACIKVFSKTLCIDLSTLLIGVIGQIVCDVHQAGTFFSFVINHCQIKTNEYFNIFKEILVDGLQT